MTLHKIKNQLEILYCNQFNRKEINKIQLTDKLKIKIHYSNLH
jgi:hypothetical protein